MGVLGCMEEERTRWSNPSTNCWDGLGVGGHGRGRSPAVVDQILGWAVEAK
jgi:hypothetical protein